MAQRNRHLQQLPGSHGVTRNATLLPARVAVTHVAA